MRRKIFKFQICICLAVYTCGGYFIMLYQIRTRSKDEITKLSEALATLTPSNSQTTIYQDIRYCIIFRAGVS